MAASSARMRLTVEILPLEAENSHGPYQAAALAAFKGRKFALPVQLEDTFEQVWSQIDERYKRNYLTPPQAASFTIKKLQDAYDCDLDLSDTVSSIYEGETDLTRRTIKVVPSFIHRDFSVPFTSNLRPANAQKRQRESYEDPASKRRRLEEQQHTLSEKDLSRDRPLPSTESEHSGDDGAGLIDTDHAQTIAHQTRSRSGGSVVITHNVLTGLDRFAPGVKEESPELGDPVVQPISDSEKEPSQSPGGIFKKPLLPASASKKAPHGRQLDRPPKESPQRTIPESPEQNGFAEIQDEDVQYGIEDVIMDDKLSQHSLKTTRSPESSNDPTPEASELVRNGAAVPRESIYEPPGSPDFIGGSAKRLRTYGRFPRTPRLAQKQAQAPNGSRSYSKSQRSGNGSSKSQSGIRGKARAFQKSKLDEIESTPQEMPSSPIRPAGSPADDPFISDSPVKARDKSVDGPVLAKTAAKKPIELPRSEVKPKHKPGKVSGLKKPTRIAYTMPTVPTTNAITAVQSSTAVLATPSITPVYNPFRATAPSNKQPEKKVPVKASAVQAAASKPQNRELHSEASVSKSPKAGNASPSKAVRASVTSDAKSNLTRSSGRRNSPKVIIPRKIQFMPARSQSSHSSLVQRSSSHPSISRSSVAEVASNLLNASRIPAPAKEPLTYALTSSPQDRFKKPMMKAPESMSGSNSIKNDAVQGVPVSRDMRSTPVRTEVPLPDNVKHLASQRMSVSKSPRRSVTKSEVPLPDNVKHLNKSVKAGLVHPATPSNPKSVREIFQPSSPPAMSLLGSTVKEPVEISSGESSSSDDSEEEEEVQGVAEGVSVEQRDKEPVEVEEEEEEIQDSPVKTGTVKETSPVQPELEEAELEEGNAATSGDAESLPDVDKPQTFSENEQASPEKDATPDTADSSEPPRSPVEISSAADYKGNSSPHPIPWNAGSWENGAVEQSAAATTPPKSDVEMVDVEKSHSRSHSGSASTTESESKSVAQSESISASGADSARSSPAVARQPARFLSHSPTPNNSSSEDESVAASPTPAKTGPSKLTNGRGDEIDSESSSSDSDSSSDEAEAEDSNIEMVDANVDTKAGAAPSSSPPSPQRSHRQIPPGSQPLPRKSEIPFPSIKSAIEVPSTAPLPRTKISASQLNPQTPATGLRRPTYQNFPSIKQQLSAARSTPATGQSNKGFDARTLKLSKLTKAKQQGKKGVVLDENSSSDESSSDESSSEDEGSGKGAGCSVA